jgi:hypothetical protein
VLGRRLPEYRAVVRMSGWTHNMHFVGRKCYCEIHHNSLTSSLQILPDDLPCSALAKAWNESFKQGYVEKYELPLLEERPKLQAIRSAVVATIADEISKTLSMPLSTIMIANDPDVNLWEEWQRDPTRFADALERGCNYASWTKLKLMNLTHLARPGFVDLGQLQPLTNALIGAFGLYASEVSSIWDRVANEVNVYTPPYSLALDVNEMITYFGALPVTDNPNKLMHAVRALVRQTNIYHSGSFISPSVANRRDLIFCGLRGVILDTAAGEGLSRERIDRWLAHGCSLRGQNRVAALEHLAAEYPNVSDAFIAWWNTFYWRSAGQITPDQYPPKNEFGVLPPYAPRYRTSQELISAESLIKTRTSEMMAEEEKELLASVVPADWWHSRVTIDVEDTTPNVTDSEAEAEGLFL